MRTRDKQRHVEKIRKEAAALISLTNHIDDIDLIEKAYERVQDAVGAYRDALEDE